MDAKDFGKLLKDHPKMLDDAKIFASFLRDIYPAEKGNVNLMIITYNAGVVSMLRGSELDSLLISRIMSVLMDNYFIAEEKARWAAELWTKAFAVSKDANTHGKRARANQQPMQTTANNASPSPKASPSSLNTKRKPVSDFFTKIVGVTHNNTGANTENRQIIIQDLYSRGMLNPGQALTLEPDHENRYSENAVKVIAPDGRQLGFLSQAVADNTAPRMRDGYDCQVSVSKVTGGTQDYAYGVNIRIVVYPVTKTNLTSKASVLPMLMQETDSKYFQVEQIDSGCIIKKYIGPNNGKVIIPTKINRKNVIKIGEDAFRNCTGLTSVMIPDGVTEIGIRAFLGCTKLTSITISDSVADIGGDAFRGTPWLKKAGEFVVINRILLAYQGSDKDVVIPENVTKVGNNAFFFCGSLNSVMIPDSVTGIGNCAFLGCTKLTSVTIPVSVTQIGRRAFEGCTGLTNVAIPDCITKIEDGTYKGCTKLASVAIPNGVTKIGWGAFKGCTKLASVTIPDSITEIGDCAFSDCINLTSIIIPDNVPSIDCNVFHGCTNLKSVTIPSGNRIFGPAFMDDNNLLVIHAPAGSAAEEFAKRAKIRFQPIPTSLFKTRISVEPLQETNPNCFEVEHTDSGCIIKKYTERNAKKVVIPAEIEEEFVTEIRGFAFDGCRTLTSVTIPNSVTKIGIGAFKDCTELTDVTISDKLTKIVENTFSGCMRLTSVTIPDGVTKIENEAFADCKSLTIAIIPGSVTEIGGRTFHGCNISLVLYAPAGSAAEKYAKANHFGFQALTTQPKSSAAPIQPISTPLSKTSVFNKPLQETDPSYFEVEQTDSGCIISNYIRPNIGEVIIPTKINGNSVTKIGNLAFYGCTGLTSVTIPNSVTEIGWNTFEGCTNLTSITIPDSVTKIKNWAFKGCTSLTSVVIPDGAIEIGRFAFYGCASLISVVIPDSVTEIGENAFEGTPWLMNMGEFVIINHLLLFYRGNSENVTIPKGVTKIGDLAFSDCADLVSVTIPDSVTYIGDSAFRGCTSLTSVTIPDSVADVNCNAFEKTPWLFEQAEAFIIVNHILLLYQGNDEKVIIPKGVAKIGESAFEAADAASVTIPNSVTKIGACAFKNCTDLSSVIIPDSVIEIGHRAFYNCSSLLVIHAPAGSVAEKYAKENHVGFQAI